MDRTTNVEMCSGESLNLNIREKLDILYVMSTETKMWAFLNMVNEYHSQNSDKFGFQTLTVCTMIWMHLNSYRTEKWLNNSPTLWDVFEGRPGWQSTLNLPIVTQTGEWVRHRAVRQWCVKTEKGTPKLENETCYTENRGQCYQITYANLLIRIGRSFLQQVFSSQTFKQDSRIRQRWDCFHCGGSSPHYLAVFTLKHGSQ